MKKPPCGNREVNNAIFSCPKVVQMQFANSGKHVNTPNNGAVLISLRTEERDEQP